ncbi:MAG TPA: bifunctional [glutamine synthetase] adenylyltransferase/[glutamine synthetase]-adenylyl-L-tyrosine phosphorylase [Acidimicrobiia bacterium]|nr:bifunctional [glutamine synthetase] adenylyltransferase/[glutamine synthetase]-adenylyl-L-tyrosine phosphorylase [Acidimicrobiia bacterium]
MSAAASVLKAPEVAEVIDRAAEPGQARLGLTRLLDAHPELADRLAADRLFASALVALSDASRSLSEAVIADPGLLAPLDDPEALATECPQDRYTRQARQAVDDDAEDPGRGLRRWKRQELLRIAVRDLLGLSDLPVVGRELASLAEGCLQAALTLARAGAGAGADVRMAVIGMGKLGGRELNYSSDVDVLFVHEGDSAAAERIARKLLTTMAQPTPHGIVFRTDADLRPEGRAGPLTRSLDAFRAYWEKWASTWEFQALIKARPVAGDSVLGRAFLEAAQPHVWPERLDPDAIREVRMLKARAEEEISKRGLAEREIKRGRGGLRDIEFAVQLLQLVHGRHDPGIRSPNTLDALDQLARFGYVDTTQVRTLDAAYRFLRTVEHRLQLVDEGQVHALPLDVDGRTRLARVLGYRDTGSSTALEQFEAAHRRQQAQVRSIHEKLFFRPLLEAIAGTGPLSQEAAEERLAAFGFRDVAQTRAALEELTTGLSRRSQLMGQLFPLLLEWLSETPDPDMGLLQLRRLAEGRARSGALAVTFREAPGAAQRVCQLLGSSRLVGDALRRHPEFVPSLADDAYLAHCKGREELVEEAVGTLAWRADVDERREGLRRFKRRELLRIAARDLLGCPAVEAIGGELASLAEAALEAILHESAPPVPFAVIGMGRFGSRELSYASDIDVLFVYAGSGAADFDAAEKTATRVVSGIGATTAEGQTFRIDLNLRPEGKQGPLARSLDGYRSYYEKYALTWEFQSLLKARPVAGDMALAERFCTMVEPFVFKDPFPADDIREVRRMKARVERERIPPGEDPQFHLKLGRGSLSDVEWTVQLLQLIHGGADPQLRTTSTVGGLALLAERGLVEPSDADALQEAYRFCERARNLRYLLTGAPGDFLPTDGAEAQRLARLMGYSRQPVTSLRDDYRRLTRRARAVVERVFYGQS